MMTLKMRKQGTVCPQQIWKQGTSAEINDHLKIVKLYICLISDITLLLERKSIHSFLNV